MFVFSISSFFSYHFFILSPKQLILIVYIHLVNHVIEYFINMYVYVCFYNVWYQNLEESVIALTLFLKSGSY